MMNEYFLAIPTYASQKGIPFLSQLYYRTAGASDCSSWIRLMFVFEDATLVGIIISIIIDDNDDVSQFYPALLKSVGSFQSTNRLT